MPEIAQEGFDITPLARLGAALAIAFLSAAKAAILSAPVTLLSAIERENRALAQVAKERMHPAANTALARRSAAPGSWLGRALQQPPLDRCHWLHHAEGHARSSTGADPY
jgi:hypothetical protein